MLHEMAYWFLFMMLEIVVMEKAMHKYVSSYKQAILSANQIAGTIISFWKGLPVCFLMPEWLGKFYRIATTQQSFIFYGRLWNEDVLLRSLRLWGSVNKFGS